MSEKASQRQRILGALLCNEKLTPLDALRRFGCFRLGARIWELKRDGYKIERTMVTKRGKTYAQYHLESNHGS